MIFNLKNPYPFETSINKRWRMCFFIGGFVFLFLFVFQPFGLNTLKHNIFEITLGYGFASLFVMAGLNILLVFVFPKYFSENNWTTLKAIFWSIINIGLIGLANAIYSAFIGIGYLSFHNLFWFEVYALVIGVFPTGVSVLVNQARLKSKFERESEKINLIFEKPKEAKTEKYNLQEITIYSENGKDNFSLLPDDLLFIRASDNYVEVFYTTKNGGNYKLLRNSLKSIANSLSLQTYFFRCHKSYLVNLKQVKHISGNAQGYKLHLKETDELIPVSRTQNETIKERLILCS